MTDGWTEHRVDPGLGAPARFVLTDDSRAPEQLAADAPTHQARSAPVRPPVPTGRTRPWRPSPTGNPAPRRGRPPRLGLRVLLLAAGPALIVGAALVAAPRAAVPEPPAPTTTLAPVTTR